MQNVQESSSLPLEKETARESQRAWQRWNEYSRECDGRQFPWRDVARDDAHDACHLPDRKSISGKRNGKQGFDTRPSRYKQGQGRERVYTSSVDVCHGNGRLDASITAIFSSVTITEQREREWREKSRQIDVTLAFVFRTVASRLENVLLVSSDRWRFDFRRQLLFVKTNLFKSTPAILNTRRVIRPWNLERQIFKFLSWILQHFQTLQADELRLIRHLFVKAPENPQNLQYSSS